MDPERSLEGVEQRGTLRVGVIDRGGAVDRGEEDLLRRWARSLGAAVERTEGDAEELMDALRHLQLDVVAGGLTSSNPWKEHVAFTRPYLRERELVGVPAGASAGELAGLRVGVRRGTPLEAWLREQEADIVPVADPGAFDGPIAAGEHELAARGLRPTEHVFRERAYVMAVPRGENALLASLERFLLREREARDRPSEASGR